MTATIITDESYTSLADKGNMDELKKSSMYEVVGPEKKALEEWKTKTEIKHAEKKKALDITKRMKKKGYDTTTIKELTGLSVSAIGKL